ncbi:MAG: aminoacyl-tRNA hydrolase [Oscillospiraceae bacterium]|nr:aminoacyl-tRNA hydrolase [Oscillospiraceae bacterium]
MKSEGAKSRKIGWIIAFLGNPGIKYSGTRHNAGFMAGDALGKMLDVRINRAAFKALTAKTEINGEKVLLLKPQTYMNLSGESVAKAARYYKVPAEHVIVLSDEMHLALGNIRVRTKGSAGGHNGLKNIISELGTDNFPRIRIGVGEPPTPEYDMKDWALSALRNADAELLRDASARAAEAAVSYIADGAEKTMNTYNGGSI